MQMVMNTDRAGVLLSQQKVIRGHSDSGASGTDRRGDRGRPLKAPQSGLCQSASLLSIFDAV